MCTKFKGLGEAQLGLLLTIIFHLRPEGGKEQNYDFAEMKIKCLFYNYFQIQTVADTQCKYVTLIKDYTAVFKKFLVISPENQPAS